MQQRKFGCQGSGFRVWGLGFRVRGFRVSGFRVRGIIRVQGLAFRVQGSGFKPRFVQLKLSVRVVCIGADWGHFKLRFDFRN